MIRLDPPLLRGIDTSSLPVDEQPVSVDAIRRGLAQVWGEPYLQPKQRHQIVTALGLTASFTSLRGPVWPAALQLSPTPAGCRLVRAPLTSADHARERLRWCIAYDRAAVPVGRWHLAREHAQAWRNPRTTLSDLYNPASLFRGRSLSIPSVALEFQRWLKPRYRWRWRR